jgi:hypothetical protein
MSGGDHHDFDFQAGEWKVVHRRLTARLRNSTDWQEFGGTCAMRLILGGQGNIEDNLIDLPAGAYRASAIRSFDAKAGTWAIWWLDMRAPHSLDVPVIGSFTNGIGEFFADDTLDGRPIHVRFRWLDTATDSPSWEQAFSPDAGATWETNWTMRFRRA